MNKALLRALASMDDGESEDKPISKEGQIARIEEMAKRYHAGNPFKVGDWVTPRSDVNLKGVGDPHKVVQVRIDPTPHWLNEPGLPQNGAEYDLRVCYIARDDVVFYWVESFNFQPYIP